MKIQVRELRAAHETAVKDRLDKFVIAGFTVLTRYAYYLLQFIEQKGLKDSDYIELTAKDGGKDEI